MKKTLDQRSHSAEVGLYRKHSFLVTFYYSQKHKKQDFKTGFQALNRTMSVNGFLGLQHHKHNHTFKIFQVSSLTRTIRVHLRKKIAITNTLP